MPELIGVLFQCGIPILFLLGALFIGTFTERRHLSRLRIAEDDLMPMLCTNVKSPPGLAESDGGEVVIGECVIATDYFKNFIAGLVKITGGEMRAYRSLMERARREALVRLLREAREKGYTGVCNVRLEPADVGGSAATRKGMVMSAVLASGTAYHVPGR